MGAKTDPLLLVKEADSCPDYWVERINRDVQCYYIAGFLISVLVAIVSPILSEVCVREDMQHE